MREYRPFYSDLVAEFIVNLSRRKQRKLVDLCKQLASNPFIKSDYSMKDADGRNIEHLLVGGFVIAYWVDHPACLVMITEVDDVE